MKQYQAIPAALADEFRAAEMEIMAAQSVRAGIVRAIKATTVLPDGAVADGLELHDGILAVAFHIAPPPPVP